jgi:hypothetical protein
MNMDEIIGLALAIVSLAALSVAIINGDKTAKVLGAAGDVFVKSIKAATQQR